MNQFIIRIIFSSLGFLCVFLGVLGILLPLLPATPFFLLATYLLNRGSPRMHRWLMGIPGFGPVLEDLQARGIIRRPVKAVVTVIMLMLLLYPLFFESIPLYYKVLMTLAAAGLLVYIWSRPSR